MRKYFRYTKKKQDGFTEKQYTDGWFRNVKTNLSRLQSIFTIVFYEQASIIRTRWDRTK